MNNKFLIIKYEGNCKDFITIFTDLLGNTIEFKETSYGALIYHSYENDLDIENTLLSLSDELLINLVGYLSRKNESLNKLKQEEEIALSLIKDLSLGVYDLKKALLAVDIIPNKLKTRSFILNGSGVDESFIKSFLNYNLNVSKASKELFIHRNTMLYKLDRLKELSGFDLRSFKDAYILFSLLEKR